MEGGRHVAGSSSRSRVLRSVRGAALLLCFGFLGLVWLLPPARRRRRRRAAACTACRRRQRVGTVALAGFAVLLLVGAAARTQMAVLEDCGVRFAAGAEEVVAETPTPDVAPGLWARTRAAVNAPIGGVMLVATRAAGMEHCSGSSVLVAFSPAPTPDGGGSVVGDVFVSWIGQLDASGVALPGQESYVRFGSDTNARPDLVEAIARHESRHVDQWAIGTVVGGPLALPTAYYLDSLLFPLSRNHFERAAGLEDGGYEIPPDFGPSPLWPPLVLSLALLVVILRRRVRWASRVLVGGLSGARAHDEDHCPVHSRGWFHSAPAPRPPDRPDDVP
ncbi:hypothetical protein [Janibacter sp. DB-40]|uniref:hypothetical protein n=1 Tax=Janibacter sp. DB-40 TaxID=3028808 RepID=UPI00240549A7|nr:hypothetical protein [Janibacter sp. DB-40]